MTENKVTFQLNVKPRDAIEVVLTRLKAAQHDLEEAHESLKYSVEWFSENRDSTVTVINQLKDVRELLFEVDQNLDEHSQVLARLMMIQGASFLPMPQEAPNDGLLDKALEDLQKKDKPEDEK